MDKQKVNEFLNSYIDNFDWLMSPPQEELYKWQVAYHIYENREKWNLDTCDLKEMLKAIGGCSYNLIDNASVQPIGGLLSLCEKYEDDVRNELKLLLKRNDEENITPQEKVERFITNVNELLIESGDTGWRYKQDLRSTISLLALFDPENNYMYKATPKSYFINYTNHEDLGSGIDFRLDAYYKMCDNIKSIILETDIPKMLDEALVSDKMEYLYKEYKPYKDLVYPGEKLLELPGKYNLLVYDVLYCVQNYQLCGKVRAKSKKEREGEILLQERRDYEIKLEETKEQIETLLETIGIEARSLKGRIVHHKTYGEGLVTNVEEAKLVVQFDAKEAKFPLPDAIANGFLTLDDSIKDKMAFYKAKLKELDQESKLLTFELVKRGGIK